MKEILAPAVLSILEAFGHHASVLEMPEINIFGVVAAEKKIEFSIAVVIKPDCCIRIYPGGQTGLFSNARECLAAIVMKQLRSSPFVKEHIFVTIVIVIAPHSAH